MPKVSNLRRYMNIKREIKDILARLNSLDENSHPPVNWQELIQSNSARLDELEKKKIVKRK